MKMQSNKKLVLITPDKAEEKTEGGIILPDLVKENMNKKQNQGRVVGVGAEVSWPSVGDYVSFYRNAATPVIENGTEYLVIHCDHILVKFTENEQ